MIDAHPDVLAGAVGSSALADNNIAGRNRLAAKNLYAQAFALAFSIVFAGAFGFCMGHAFSVTIWSVIRDTRK